MLMRRLPISKMNGLFLLTLIQDQEEPITETLNDVLHQCVKGGYYVGRSISKPRNRGSPLTRNYR